MSDELRSKGSAWSFRIPVIAYLVAVIAVVENQYALFDFPLDDAWIHRVYSRSFAFGHGFAYNAGCQEAGASSPLWAIVTAPAEWLGLNNPDYAAFGVKLITVMLGLTVVLASVRIARQLSGSVVVAGIAGVLVAVEPRLLFSSWSGMETVLLVAIWAWSCVALIERRWILFLALLGCAPVARPEAVVILPAAAMGIVGLVRSHRAVRFAIAGLLLLVGPMLCWSLFCLRVTGHFLPNTFYLKAHPFELNGNTLLLGVRAMTSQGLASLWAYPVGMAAFFVFCAMRKPRAGGACLLMLVGFAVVYLFGVVGTRSLVLDGYYWTRWIDPAAIVLSIPFSIGLGLLVMPLVRRCGRDLESSADGPASDRPGGRTTTPDAVPSAHGAVAVVLLSLGALAALVSVPAYCRTFADRRAHLASDSRAIHLVNVDMGEWIKENTRPDDVVGVNDAGAIHYFGDRYTIDLIGLNNADVAFGRLTFADAVKRSQWLVIFPGVFPAQVVKQISAEFEVRNVIQIPPAEYTICRAYSQTVEVALKRKAPTSSSRSGP